MPTLFRRLAAFALGLVLAGASCLAIAADNPRVKLKTGMGEIVLELYPSKAPKSVANFLQYVKDGHTTARSSIA
ncbi:MAG: peptidylprolyl isomerase [Burkholderiaceae bacterium]|nr:peptidylprolyl isomerase [Burkholderiaceae bacterium]